MDIASMLQGVATLAWVVALGALGFAVFSAARGRRFAGGAITVIVAVVAALILTTVAAGLVFVQPDELGAVPRVLRAVIALNGVLEREVVLVVPQQIAPGEGVLSALEERVLDSERLRGAVLDVA